MNIMHNKTEKFINHYVTRRTENDITQRSIQISANQPAWIRQIPVTMLQQMFKVTSTCFRSAMQTFAPLIDSVVDRCRWNQWMRRQLPETRVTPADLN